MATLTTTTFTLVALLVLGFRSGKAQPETSESDMVKQLAMHSEAYLQLLQKDEDTCYQFQCAFDENLNRCPRVVTPNDFDYDNSRQQWASMMSSSTVSDKRLHPMMIFYCSEPEHVVQAIGFARDCEYKVSVRSGGHQYAGFSSCVEGYQCIQLDVSGLDTFRHGVDGVYSRVTLGAGLKLEDVTDRLLPLGLSIPTGICNTVGVGGHFQSSSYGFLSKAFGLGLDHVRSFELVKADGSIVTVDQDTDSELYWAVLGGSPGSWGVVLSYTIDTLPYQEYPHTQVGVFTLPYTHEIYVQFSKNFVKIMSDEANARDFGVLAFVSPLGPPDNNTGLFTYFISLQALWIGIDNGPWTDAWFQKYLKPLINPMPGVQALPAPFPHMDMTPVPMHHITNSILLTNFDNSPFRYHVHSMSANEWFNESFLEAAATELDNRMKIPMMYSSFQYLTMGGGGSYGSQLNRNVGKNAYPARDTKIHLDDWVFFLDDDTATLAQNHIENFRESTMVHWTADNSASKSWMTTSTIDSVQDLTVAEDKFVDYFPNAGWFQRLQAAKDAVDPTDLFSSMMTIPTTSTMNAHLLQKSAAFSHI